MSCCTTAFDVIRRTVIVCQLGTVRFTCIARIVITTLPALRSTCTRLFLGTVSADEIGFKPYLIIDDNGCSLEPSLYDDVTVIYASKLCLVGRSRVGVRSTLRLCSIPHPARASQHSLRFPIW